MTQFQMILLALDAVDRGTRLAAALISKAKQNAELTPEQEAQVEAEQKRVMGQAHWKVDPDPQGQ